ncbi:MAG: histidinol dehydrogenase [Saprospiraceae bacterium]|nr:histidinol dehydrogenase [Saprospiraceae bacterium]
MNIYKYPERNEWSELTQRPAIEKMALEDTVKDILKEVRSSGDEALIRFTEQFDKAKPDQIFVSDKEIKTVETKVSEVLKAAIDMARSNIEKFHAVQREAITVVETTPGVQCWRKSVAIEKVGLYIPGGTAPLFSTILMLAIPAKLAGCREIVLCTPPDKSGNIHPAILYTANIVGITKIFKVGGAQAIAAMAYGTETVPRVNKIFGPGNQFVTKAKEIVQQSGVAIDMPAGPSEVLVIADVTCNPKFVAADLLSQAEHGTDSQVILLSDDLTVLEQTMAEVKKQLQKLPRKAIATEALLYGRAILLNSMEDCIDFSNLYAPEHLIIAAEKADAYTEQVINAGSVFLGNYSCESAGDYASGTNHTLPTNGFAKSYSGVSLDSFVKKITFQKLSKEGLENIGPAIEIMAEAEALFAHKNAVSIRLEK